MQCWKRRSGFYLDHQGRKSICTTCTHQNKNEMSQKAIRGGRWRGERRLTENLRIKYSIYSEESLYWDGDFLRKFLISFPSYNIKTCFPSLNSEFACHHLYYKSVKLILNRWRLCSISLCNQNPIKEEYKHFPLVLEDREVLTSTIITRKVKKITKK